MARAPSAPGKTWLAPHLSDGRLRALRSALVADALRVVSATPFDPVLFYAPASAGPEMTRLAEPAIPAVPQQGDDLGARMHVAAMRLLGQRGCAAALLVGTDIPLLTPEHLTEAAAQVDATTVVLGPAEDGGYYLIGMSVPCAGLFRGVTWGTDRVLAETVRAADRLGVRVAFARRAYDVDTLEDLQRLERELRALPTAIAVNVRRWFNAES